MAKAPAASPSTAPLELVSYREYGRRRGVSHVAVSHAVKAGRLREAVHLRENGRHLIDPVVADREWAERTNVAKARGPAAQTAPPMPSMPPAPRPPAVKQAALFETAEPEAKDAAAAPAPANGHRSAAKYHDARAVREGAIARREVLNLRVLEGKLVQREALERGARIAGEEVRTAWEKLAVRLAPALAVALGDDVDLAVVRRVLQAESRNLLEEVARALERAGRG